MFGGDKDTVTIHFAAEVQANISSTFLSWIFQFAGKARSIAPASVVARIKGMMAEIEGYY